MCNMFLQVDTAVKYEVYNHGEPHPLLLRRANDDSVYVLDLGPGGHRHALLPCYDK